MNLFQTLLNQPRSAIFALYNRKTNRVHLTLAKNFVKHLSTISMGMQDGTFKHKQMVRDKDDLEVVVLETLPPHELETLRIHMHYWYLYCRDLGMKFYTKKCHIIFRPRTRIGLDYNGNTVVFVELVTRRNNAEVVAVFEKMYEAEEYIRDYLVGEFIVPVYATNELTKSYVTESNNELSKLFKVRL